MVQTSISPRARALEHGYLCCHALIFTSGPFVEVVRHQNFHRSERLHRSSASSGHETNKRRCWPHSSRPQLVSVIIVLPPQGDLIPRQTSSVI